MQETKTAFSTTRTKGLRRFALAFALAATALTAFESSAAAETRTLKLYYIHTKEKAEITFKKDGVYVRSGLDKLNRFLRDWRRNEPTKMDPQLFDIIWEAYQEVGARDYIHVVSGYRSPATNQMLRETRGGQASKSQHMVGKAMDFYIPGVSLSKLREIGFRLQGGGVGYYPKSGVPFVHFDTGNVRAWPRMSRSELTKVFPRGGTLHLPPDGKPLPGYQQALADYNARKKRGQATVISEDDRKRGGSGGGLLARLFGGGGKSSSSDSGSSSSSSSRSAAPAASAPAAAPQRPGTIVAALKESQLPKPAIAPRQNAGVPVAIVPQAAPTPAPQPEPTPAPAETLVAAAPATPEYQPPIPSSRPAVLVAAAPAPEERRSAEEIEQALIASNQATPAAEVPVAAEPRDDGAAILAALAARDSEEPDDVEDSIEIASLPIPAPAPTRTIPQTATAYAPPSAEPSTAVEPLTPPVVAAAEPQPEQPAIAADADGRGGRLVVPSERPATDEVMTAALQETAATTEKSAKPTNSDAITQRIEQRPATIATADDPAVASRAVQLASLSSDSGATVRPDFLMNAQREAPEMVYTAGFNAAPPQDASSFTGNAVTFLAVARFEGGQRGGDGQPLQIQIPATN